MPSFPQGNLVAGLNRNLAHSIRLTGHLHDSYNAERASIALGERDALPYKLLRVV